MRALGAAVMAAGLIAGLTATVADAQPVWRGPGVVVASDIDGPYDDGPPPRYAPPPYSRAYPAPLPPGPPVYAPSAYGPVLPIHDIYRIVRNGGYSPLGAPQMRGNVVTIAVLDMDGEDGRLVIDAYSGRILRFVPAYLQGSRGVPAVPVAYGPPATVAARPSVPLPKPRAAASLPDRTAAIPQPQVPPAPPAALAAAAPVPAVPQPAPKPSFAPQPTQAMPPVQGPD